MTIIQESTRTSSAPVVVGPHRPLAAGHRLNYSILLRRKKPGGLERSRLDGYTEADAKALTTRSLAAEEVASAGKRSEGKILLDVCPGFGLGEPAKEPAERCWRRSGGSRPIRPWSEAFFTTTPRG